MSGFLYEVVFIYVMILHHCPTLICNIRRNLFLVNILFCVLASVRHSQVQSKIKISKTFNVISLYKAGGWGNTGWHKTNGLLFIQSFIWKAVNISLIGWNSWHFRINRPCFYTLLINQQQIKNHKLYLGRLFLIIFFNITYKSRSVFKHQEWNRSLFTQSR